MKMIGVASAAAIAFAPFAVLATPAASADPCTGSPQSQACLDCLTRAAPTNTQVQMCLYDSPGARAPAAHHPDCDQYTLPTDRGRCEDQHAAGQR
jgi:hypothetical protein